MVEQKVSPSATSTLPGIVAEIECKNIKICSFVDLMTQGFRLRSSVSEVCRMLGDIFGATNIYIITGYTDMRKRLNGLYAIVMDQLKEGFKA